MSCGLKYCEGCSCELWCDCRNQLRPVEFRENKPGSPTAKANRGATAHLPVPGDVSRTATPINSKKTISPTQKKIHTRVLEESIFSSAGKKKTDVGKQRGYHIESLIDTINYHAAGVAELPAMPPSPGDSPRPSGTPSGGSGRAIPKTPDRKKRRAKIEERDTTAMTESIRSRVLEGCSRAGQTSPMCTTHSAWSYHDPSRCRSPFEAHGVRERKPRSSLCVTPFIRRTQPELAAPRNVRTAMTSMRMRHPVAPHTQRSLHQTMTPQTQRSIQQTMSLLDHQSKDFSRQRRDSHASSLTALYSDSMKRNLRLQVPGGGGSRGSTPGSIHSGLIGTKTKRLNTPVRNPPLHRQDSFDSVANFGSQLRSLSALSSFT